MGKYFSGIVVMYCLSCSFYGIAMEDSKKYEDEVIRVWGRQEALALRLIEESEKTSNWVRYHRNDDDAAGSFNAKLDRVSIYVYRNPEKKDERVEVQLNIAKFKELLKQPMPSPRLDDGPVADHFAPHPDEQKKRCACCCYFLCCCSN